jgi:hypothetical protein
MQQQQQRQRPFLWLFLSALLPATTIGQIDDNIGGHGGKDDYCSALEHIMTTLRCPNEYFPPPQLERKSPKPE